MDAAGAGVVRELCLVDAHLREQALERIGVAARDRHLREVSLRLVPRHAGVGGVELRVHALPDVRHGELATPFADLDDDGDVLADRDVLELELPLRVGERGDERIARDVAAAIARRPGGDRRDGRIRDVHEHVVEGYLAGGIEDRAAQRRRQSTRALHLLLAEPHARLLSAVAAAAVTVAVAAEEAAARGPSAVVVVVVALTEEGIGERPARGRDENSGQCGARQEDVANVHWPIAPREEKPQPWETV